MACPEPLNENRAEEPSIIIHPSLYERDRRFLLQTVCETFIEMARILAIVALPATLVYEVAQARLHQQPREDHSAAHPLLVRKVHPEERGPEAPLHSKANAEVFFQTASCAYSPRTMPATASPEPPSAAKSAAVAKGRPHNDSASSATVTVNLASGVRTARRMLALNRLDAADKAYRAVLSVDSHQTAALMGLSRVRLIRGDLDEALSLAQQAVETDPEHIGSRLILADVLRSRGAKILAEVEYAAATRLDLQRTAEAGSTVPPAR